MIKDKVVTVVMPAYNAEKTLEKTYQEIPFDIVDHVILVDDKSSDRTIEKAHELAIKHVISHDKNKGYGGNQKTCYDKALELKSDIIIMLHPDYQYTPKLIHAMAFVIADNVYSVVFGSRILGKGALKGGMPFYKYVSNRMLTLIQNILMNNKLSEYHTGYRAFSAEVLRSIDYHKCSDNFVFDNQVIAQICNQKYEIAELTCPTKYFPEASSIKLYNSMVYGIGVLNVAFRYFLHKAGICKYEILK